MGKGSVRRARKRIEDVVQYALGHQIRIQILTVLNEGIYTLAEIALIIDMPKNTVKNHLRHMVEDGSIEIDSKEEAGNHRQYKYRAVVMKEYTAEEFERLPFRQRQNITGAILSAGIAEILAGFHAGKLAEPNAHLYGARYQADEQGWEDADALMHQYLRGLREIEDESTARAGKSGQPLTSKFLNLVLFARPRKGPDRLHRSLPERATAADRHLPTTRWQTPRRFFGWGDHKPPSL